MTEKLLTGPLSKKKNDMVDNNLRMFKSPKFRKGTCSLLKFNDLVRIGFLQWRNAVKNQDVLKRWSNA